MKKKCKLLKSAHLALVRGNPHYNLHILNIACTDACSPTRFSRTSCYCDDEASGAAAPYYQGRVLALNIDKFNYHNQKLKDDFKEFFGDTSLVLVSYCRFFASVGDLFESGSKRPIWYYAVLTRGPFWFRAVLTRYHLF